MPSPPSRVPDAAVPAPSQCEPGMRALPFHHLLQRHALPRGRSRHRDVARAARLRSRVPGGADLLRPDARQHRLRGGAAGGAVRRVFAGAEAIVSPSASCVGFVRERLEGGPPVYELSEFVVDVLGVTDVGASFPHRVTLHPTCHSLRGCRSATGRSGCCAPYAGSTSWSWARRRSAAGSAGRSRSRTPTCRWRCWATSCAMCSTRARRSAPRSTRPA